VREGRDVVTSKHPSKHPDSYYVSPRRWVNDVSAGIRYFYHRQVKTIRYEDLVLKHGDTINDLLEFLELPFSKELLHFDTYTSVRQHHAWPSEVQPIYPHTIGRWKKQEYAVRIQEFYQYKGSKRLLAQLGYVDIEFKH